MQLVPDEEIMNSVIRLSEIRYKIHQDDDKTCGNSILGVSIGIRIPKTEEAWRRIIGVHKQEIVKVGMNNDPYRYFLTDRTFRLKSGMEGLVDPILYMRRDMNSPIYLRESNK